MQRGVNYAISGYETDERSLLGERGIKRLITVLADAMSAECEQNKPSVPRRGYATHERTGA